MNHVEIECRLFLTVVAAATFVCLQLYLEITCEWSFSFWQYDTADVCIYVGLRCINRYVNVRKERGGGEDVYLIILRLEADFEIWKECLYIVDILHSFWIELPFFDEGFITDYEMLGFFW